MNLQRTANSVLTLCLSQGDNRKPQAMHVEEALEEDDSFLSVGSETWDYEVAEGREDDFIAALENSQMVMEYIRLDSAPSPIES